MPLQKTHEEQSMASLFSWVLCGLHCAVGYVVQEVPGRHHTGGRNPPDRYAGRWQLFCHLVTHGLHPRWWGVLVTRRLERGHPRFGFVLHRSLSLKHRVHRESPLCGSNTTTHWHSSSCSPRQVRPCWVLFSHVVSVRVYNTPTRRSEIHGDALALLRPISGSSDAQLRCWCSVRLGRPAVSRSSLRHLSSGQLPRVFAPCLLITRTPAWLLSSSPGF